jgi:hypothetical protein
LLGINTRKRHLKKDTITGFISKNKQKCYYYEIHNEADSYLVYPVINGGIEKTPVPVSVVLEMAD